MKMTITIKGWLARLLGAKPQRNPVADRLLDMQRERLKNDSKEFKCAASAALQWVAEHQHYFNTDDIWAYLDSMNVACIPDPRVIGAVIKRFQADGKIHPTSVKKPSKRKVNHGREIRVWRSHIWKSNS